MRTALAVAAVAALIGVAAFAYAHLRTKPCERLDEICSRPSMSNLQRVLVCAEAGKILAEGRTEKKCARILEFMGE